MSHSSVASRPAGSSQLQADLLLLVVTLAAAAGWIFSKHALAELQPLWFIGTRFLMAGACLALFCWPQLRQLSKRALFAGLTTGTVFGVAMMIWITGLSMSDHVGESAFIVSLGVMFVPIFARVFFAEPLSWSVLAALPFGVAGLAFLNLGGNVTQGWQWNAAHLVLVSAACIFAFQFSLTGFLAKRIDPLPLTTMQLIVAGIVAMIGSWWLEGGQPAFSSTALSHLLAAALIASSLRFFLQTKALQFSPASHAGMILLLEPVWVTLMGFVFMAQRLSGYQLIGCGLIFFALVFQKFCQLWRK